MFHQVDFSRLFFSWFAKIMLVYSSQVLCLSFGFVCTGRAYTAMLPRIRLYGTLIIRTRCPGGARAVRWARGG